MTAIRQARPPAPTFTANVEITEYVDVDIDPEDLEDAGWVYVGDGDTTALQNQTARAIVERWHEATHEGPWTWCQQEPCHEIGHSDWTPRPPTPIANITTTTSKEGSPA